MDRDRLKALIRQVAERRRNTPAKFWLHVSKPSLFECWTWNGTVGTHGYGQFKFEGRIWRAHRLAFFLHHGALDAAAIICHSCDNPLCVNPAHLSAGTHADNAADRMSRGRHRYGPPKVKRYLCGSALPQAKITEDDVREIRRLRAEGRTLTQLATQYPLHPMTIGEICRREIWRHVA